MCYNQSGGFMKYEIGKKIIGIVSGITEYGIFVKFEDSYTGLIHISEISDRFVNNIHNVAKVGDKIKVKVIEIDHDNNHLKLSIKNFNYKNINKDTKIIETASGFNTLASKRDLWIKQNLKTKKITNTIDM